MKTHSKSFRRSDPPGSNPPVPVPRSFSRVPSHDEIAARAQMIWEEDGRPQGRAAENWLQAERELTRPLPETGHEEPAVNLDRDGAVAGPIEVSLDQVASPSERRSPTSL